MSRLLGSGLVLITAALLATASCTAPSKGALMLAISTDMQTPKDINVVSVFISTNDTPKFDFLGRVLPNGTVALPATVAVVEPDSLNAQVRIRVIGFQEQNARVLRDVLTTVPHQQTSLLRLPLDFLDVGSVKSGSLPKVYLPDEHSVHDGPTNWAPTDPASIIPTCDFTKGLTSIHGKCVSAAVDSSKLPAYDPTEVYGDGGLAANGAPTSCFDVQTCFQGATPVTGLDTQACTFPLPSGADPSTLNLALVTPTTGACLPSGGCYVPMPQDPDEGWTLEGSSVRLLPGVCAKLGAGVTLAVATGACPAESLSQSVCEPTGADAGAPPVVDAGVDATVVDVSPADTGGDATAADATLDAPADASPPEGAGTDAGACFPLPSGAVSWWSFEGALTDAVGQNEGAATGSITYVPGLVGQAAHFAGASYVLSTSVGLPAGAADRTVELWARFEATYLNWNDAAAPRSGLFFGYGTWGSLDGTYELYVAGAGEDDTVGFSQWGGGVASSTVAENAWHHVAAIYSQGSVTLFVDGASVVAQALAVSTASGAEAYFGGMPSPPDLKPEYLTGAVDEVTVYSRALAPAEIVAIYTAGRAGKCPASAADAGGVADAAGSGDAGGCGPLNTTTNCGACGAACDTTTSLGAACAGSTCTYTGCAPGYADCDTSGPNSTGCECATPGCCGTSCQTHHTSTAPDGGASPSWYDCAATGTYDVTEATAACAAVFGAGGCQSGWTCSSMAQAVVCDGACTTCWAYGTAGGTYPTTAGTLTNCGCPSVVIGSWQ